MVGFYGEISTILHNPAFLFLNIMQLERKLIIVLILMMLSVVVLDRRSRARHKNVSDPPLKKIEIVYKEKDTSIHSFELHSPNAQNSITQIPTTQASMPQTQPTSFTQTPIPQTQPKPIDQFPIIPKDEKTAISTSHAFQVVTPTPENGFPSPTQEIEIVQKDQDISRIKTFVYTMEYGDFLLVVLSKVYSGKLSQKEKDFVLSWVQKINKISDLNNIQAGTQVILPTMEDVYKVIPNSSKITGN